MITPISKGGNRGSKSFNPMSRATRLVSSRAGPLTTLVTGHVPSPQHRLFPWLEQGQSCLDAKPNLA